MRSLPLLLVLSSIPAILATSSAGLFDLTEFRRVTYDASIGEDFLWFAPNLDIGQLSLKNIDDFEREIAEKIPEEKDENYVFVTSKGGQKFACSLPYIEHLKKPTATKSSKNPKVYGDLLAASFYVNKCIHLRGNHWWTYTLCRGQTVEQIHGEVGSADYAKNILGIFDGTLTMPPYSESTDDRLLYVEESYTAGTYCDLEDYRQPRRISVRYECEPALSTNEAFIESVVEVKPCNYLMTVKVGTLCSYPEFLPVSQANTRNVACQPYLSKTQVREILEKRLEGQERTDDLEWEEQEARDASKMAERRFSAMTKSARRLYLPDKAKLINAEMDLRAAHFDLLTIGVELAGVKITEERNDAMWKRLNTVGFFDHVLYVNYDNIEDENRAYLWYYFNDPTWPKDQFPKDIYYTAIQNGYIEEVQANIKGIYNYDDDNKVFEEALRKFLKTGVLDLSSNLVIPATEILVEIAKNGTTEPHPDWLYSLYHTFLFKKEDVYHFVSGAMRVPKKERGSPMGTYAQFILSTFLVDIEDNMNVINSNGKPQREDSVFEVLSVKQTRKESGKGVNFEISLENENVAMHKLQEIYLAKLVPLYQMISILYFQETYPKYFNVWPPTMRHIKSKKGVDFEFHQNLAQDALEFSRLLSISTIQKMKYFIKMQFNENKPVFTSEMYFKMRQIFEEMADNLWELEYEEYVEIAMKELFSNNRYIDEARMRLWAKRVEKYKMDYWMKDYKLRNEAKSTLEIVKSILGAKNPTKALWEEGAKIDVDSIMNDGWKTSGKKVAWKKLPGGGHYADLNPDDFRDNTEIGDQLSDMREVAELLGKAGLNKDVLQVKVLDANGNELGNMDLGGLSKDLFEKVDAMARMKQTEKAYAKKFVVEDEEEEPLE